MFKSRRGTRTINKMYSTKIAHLTYKKAYPVSSRDSQIQDSGKSDRMVGVMVLIRKGPVSSLYLTNEYKSSASGPSSSSKIFPAL